MVINHFRHSQDLTLMTLGESESNSSPKQALVGYIKLLIICIFFIVLDISLISFILIVNVWLV